MDESIISILAFGVAFILSSWLGWEIAYRMTPVGPREEKPKLRERIKRKVKGLKKERMTSYVLRANKLMSSGNPREAKKTLSNGMKYYSGKVIKAISPYASADAGLLSFALHTLANEIEASQPGSRALREELERITEGTLSKSTEKVQKPTAR